MPFGVLIAHGGTFRVYVQCAPFGSEGAVGPDLHGRFRLIRAGGIHNLASGGEPSAAAEKGGSSKGRIEIER